MKRQHTRQWLDLVTHSLGSNPSIQSNLSEDDLDDLFELNFGSLYKDEIISIVNCFIINDPDSLYSKFGAFKQEVEANFESTAEQEVKQKYAAWVADQLQHIKHAAKRLSHALKAEWGLPHDPRFDYSFHRKDLPFTVLVAQKEHQLVSAVNLTLTEEDKLIAELTLDAFRLSRRVYQDHFYAVLLMVDQTERYLYDWLELYAKSDKEISVNSSFISSPKSDISTTQQPVSQKLTHPQIAILYHYNKQPITDNNSNGIALQYGQKSGKRLKLEYDRLTSALTRTARGKYTVSNIRKVIELLSDEALALAQKDLKDAEKNNQKKF